MYKEILMVITSETETYPAHVLYLYTWLYFKLCRPCLAKTTRKIEFIKQLLFKDNIVVKRGKKKLVLNEIQMSETVNKSDI